MQMAGTASGVQTKLALIYIFRYFQDVQDNEVGIIYKNHRSEAQISSTTWSLRGVSVPRGVPATCEQ